MPCRPRAYEALLRGMASLAKSFYPMSMTSALSMRTGRITSRIYFIQIVSPTNFTPGKSNACNDRRGGKLEPMGHALLSLDNLVPVPQWLYSMHAETSRLRPLCAFARRQGSFLSAHGPRCAMEAEFSSVARSKGNRSKSALQAAGEGNSGTEQGDESKLEGRGVNRRKRVAKRAKDWGLELIDLGPKELQHAARYADLSEEVVDAVKLAKMLGRGGKNGWRRQISYVGGLLRSADHDLLESAVKSARDGGLGGFMPPAGASMTTLEASSMGADGTDDEEEDDDDDEEEEEQDFQGAPSSSSTSSSSSALSSSRGRQLEARKWMQGLLAGDKHISELVYALNDPLFDRQQLRRLVRAAAPKEVRTEILVEEGAAGSSAEREPAGEPGEAGLEGESADAHAQRAQVPGLAAAPQLQADAKAEKALLHFLLDLVSRQHEARDLYAYADEDR
eukprot:jgi/Mesen1/1928/ME000146S01012